ncbi:MAG: lamin tail domain-containing protein [Kofleriaceae bacterium]|nr:lamin tail domain-containing protein [Kofleriaceae bacterium]MBP9202742.1 lamin tail domain-containing protein [Kofleriaceae bacterium]
MTRPTDTATPTCHKQGMAFASRPPSPWSTRPLLGLGLSALLACAAGCGPDDGTDPGVCKQAMLAGDIVISEVFADASAPEGSSGADEGREWFEIYNNSGGAIDLEGLTIVHARPDDTRPNQHIMGTLTVPAGGYAVLGNILPDLRPGWVTYGYASDLGDLFNTNGGKLTLKCTDTIIDEAIYDNVKPGASRQYDGGARPDYTGNDDAANWCEATPEGSLEFDVDNYGTPGEQNEDCAVIVTGMCSDGGTMRASVPAMPGDLVITEVMPSPGAVSDTTGEWFEVEVHRDLDLNGLVLDRAGDSSAGDELQDEACLHVTAGTRLVFAKSMDPIANGMLPRVDGLFGFSMVGGSVSSPGDVQLTMNGTLIDAITWTSSRAPALQVDPDFADATANDMPGVWCDATTPYGAGDLGTPGAMNAECTILPPAGMCMDGATLRPVAPPQAGNLVITEFMVSPAGDDTKQEWFEIKNVGVDSFDLNDLQLDRVGDTLMPVGVRSVDCKPVAGGGHALFARSTVPADNDMLPAVDATFNFSLVPSGDLRVLDSAGAELDAVVWTSAPNAAARQLDPDQESVAGSVEANFCAATTAYGLLTNKGTPKAANLQCP